MLEWLELRGLTWEDYRDANDDRQVKEFKSMRHLWVGAEAIYRDPPIVSPTRVDRIDGANRGIVLYHTFIPAPGFRLARARRAKATASWGILSFYERGWHALHVNWSLYFGDDLVSDVREFAASLPDDLDATERTHRLLNFLYKRESLRR